MTVAQQRKRYTVSVDEYVSYRRDGYLIVRGLLPPEDTNRLLKWADDMKERIAEMQQKGSILFTDEERTRVHMLHHIDETAEWGLLHPLILDVLEALIGPDVMALQSMLFFNPPGLGGQGWHQDSYYIQTQPDSLIGAWIALERADTENGCLWVAPGSHHEPVYPPVERWHNYMHPDERHIKGLFPATAVSHLDDDVNNLSEVARKYGEPVPVVLEPGDVLFFHSHLLHRSHVNKTADRYRRSYVLHYCNARSWVPWNHGIPYEGDSANKHHILARGWTHLPFAKPKYGTPVELSPPQHDNDGGAMMVAMPGGDMGKMQM
ncbi:phytanoyl-CoA dioxygenase family protein [Heyndrickxia coagulans]|jgi:Protein involved in biosynthesis of mitomycin antibiotics/polyketide fumonisin|uniref:phytanoyl-CoA dioxygenase family protein n=1 Tax=Heyndrickxia coagulans TaxID=1398 RepID=UPI0004BB01D1|nr:phytanoyl-CoA dioxygenase family protein [Heyndrickxia coagulans]NMH85866.1 phytanoyl-CoA dioxygenase family protein [Heyndrickxia coagulans]